MGYEVSIKAAKDRLSELGRMADAGEQVIITKYGKPAYELAPVRKRGGINRAALERWKAERGITSLAGPYDGDFDAPFDEDFLIKPSL
jgi:antitoxin (DNA-binding transcriptional repressor) of toxin-antitoxin stability system